MQDEYIIGLGVIVVAGIWLVGANDKKEEPNVNFTQTQLKIHLNSVCILHS